MNTGSAAVPFVIAHVSDLHFGEHDPAAVDGLVDDVAAVAPGLVVVTGDCTMRARDGQFAQARALLDRLPAPRLVVTGNHDIPLFRPGRRLLAPYAGYRAWIDPDLDPRLDLPPVRALGLQSMPRWRWKAGRVTRRQSALVAGYLGAAPADAIRLLALHHPPSAGGPARIAGRTPLLRALAAAHVDLVLAGHTHVPASHRLGPATGHGPLEVVAGTATSRRLRGVPRSWNVIRVDTGHVHVEQRYEVGGVWRSGRTVSHER
ncbi:metallophosphoesterase family protein [Dactylosporangium sp. AC04546]|uniref:metallophosphoesterase family protein n=1 Tax=Dactylosporangium sp. AC04546 TaxID=2862460 RepID=UPI001EDD24A4|nr:metallophosphoesterase [Dactylosporangium sp. AC04546]WVK79243.1 metallophosphoesterase family protein [Dactylosporangium sp. AC04546]